MYLYLIIALQGYCIYHCYHHRNQYYWILAVLFLPLIGSLLYLFMNVVQKKDIERVQENLTTVINPTKKILDLEKKLKFSETFVNQVALADAYMESERYEEALTNYTASLKDVFQNDFYVQSKMVEAHYFATQFNEAIMYAKRIEGNTKFRKSKASFLYGLAMEKQGNIERAEELLTSFDAPYCNYQERLELAKFYTRNGRGESSKTVLEEIVSESESLSKGSYNHNRIVIKRAKELLETQE